jgi:hypothetical protein
MTPASSQSSSTLQNLSYLQHLTYFRSLWRHKTFGSNKTINFLLASFTPSWDIPVFWLKVKEREHTIQKWIEGKFFVPFFIEKPSHCSWKLCRSHPRHSLVDLLLLSTIFHLEEANQHHSPTSSAKRMNCWVCSARGKRRTINTKC